MLLQMQRRGLYVRASVCLSVCVLVTPVSLAKTVETDRHAAWVVCNRALQAQRTKCTCQTGTTRRIRIMAADRAEAAAIDLLFSSSTENIFIPVSL